MAQCPSCKNEFTSGKCPFCGYEPQFFLAEAGSTLEDVFAFAEEGDTASVSLIANCYLNGEGVKTDLVKAYDYNMLAVKEYYARSYANTAIIYENGIGREKDLFSALYYYKKALELEYEGAINSITALLNSADKNDAEERYKLISWLGDQAPYSVRDGVCCEFGYGRIKDDTRAYYSYSKAARQNDLTGLYNTAYMKEFGIGTDKDIDGALSLYDKAALGGYPAAMYRLGLLYKKNRNIRDDGKAFGFLCQSAEHGVAKAQLWLSNYFSGENMIEKTVSQYWYIQALRQQGRKNSVLLKELIAKQKSANPNFPKPPSEYGDYVKNVKPGFVGDAYVKVKNETKTNQMNQAAEEAPHSDDVTIRLADFCKMVKNEKLQALLTELNMKINSLKISEHELTAERKLIFDEYLPSLATLLDAYLLYEKSQLNNEAITLAKENIEKSVASLNIAIDNAINELITHHAQQISDEAIALISKLEADGLCDTDGSTF